MKQVRFAPRSEFTKTLNENAERWFAEQGKSPFGDYRMVLKAVIITLIAAGSYLALLFGPQTPVSLILFTILFSQALVMVGFSIMHDSNHGSFSSNPLVNRILGFSLDCIGGSSLLWCQKHNFLHHSYTNINGMDDDIQTAGFIRLSPQQPWKPHYRFQHIYAPFLYSILTLYWFLVNDFIQFFSKKIGSYKIRGVTGKSTALFLLFKLVYVITMFVIPLQFHHWTAVLSVYLAVNLIAGFTISVVFQLAHTLESSEFPEPDKSGRCTDEFSIHQIRTTADFSRRSPLLTWYLGGLNFQTEHHLFPKTCHIHYPQLSSVVEQTCIQFGVPYRGDSSLVDAVKAHFSFLKAMGQNRAAGQTKREAD